MEQRQGLIIEPLTAEAFRPYGDVIESEGHVPILINDGTTQRFDDLAQVDTTSLGGKPAISIFHAVPYSLPMQIVELERHPLGSQAFVPLDGQRFMVIVAAESHSPRSSEVRAFVTNGRQGVNYRRGTWHHPLIVLHQPSRFVVIDRLGPHDNCDLARLIDAPWLEIDY